MKVEHQFVDGTVRECADIHYLFDLSTPDLHRRLELLRCQAHGKTLTRFRHQRISKAVSVFHWFSDCSSPDGEACEELIELAGQVFEQDQNRGEEFKGSCLL